jgi:DNA-3-methyladenine glycosylase II
MSTQRTVKKSKSETVVDVAAQIAHLRKSDPILAAVIEKVAQTNHVWDMNSRGRRENHFKALVIAIINQQLSGKAARTIENRFLELFSRTGRAAKKFPSPEDILKMPTPKMRRVGLSKMKVSFIKDLAKKILDGTVDFRAMKNWTDEEVIEHLTRVKGIGRWTAEMFLMFSLGRDDVFSYGDLGLRNAMERLYKLRKHPSPARAAKISGAWKPYRTLASRYLWKSLEKR